MSNLDLVLQRFPDSSPYVDRIIDDPAFDPAVHLALERPASMLSLSDLGYGQDIKPTTASPIAAMSCFRILSDEGVAAMQHVCRQLEQFTTTNDRVVRNTRGGVYRSRFLRDFCLSPEVNEYLSGLLGCELFPHAMDHQLGHLNYHPFSVGEDTSTWHYDTLQVDFVLFVTDPKDVNGGEFSIFLGTHNKAALAWLIHTSEERWQ